MKYPDTKLEEKLWQKGFRYVLGVDEAGRGPLAGPVVVGAVLIENTKQVVENVRDSKKMTKKQRKKAFVEIQEKSTAFGIGIVDAKEIDRVGIKEAVKEAMILAVSEVEKKIKKKVDYIISDGAVYLLDDHKMMSISRGDLNHYSIAAASVLAKVTRDMIMEEYSKKYPNYGFEKHMGYGTKMHLDAISKHGICDIHRKSYEPIKITL
ncbi:MAG TPA: ribonuclease HII [Candidatus Dojkabacteria bacterium]|nr:ribonuclease HII [Candidatus Dojkabacteria bacterium]